MPFDTSYKMLYDMIAVEGNASRTLIKSFRYTVSNVKIKVFT